MTARPVGSIALDAFKGHTPGPWRLSGTEDAMRHVSGGDWVRFAEVVVELRSEDDPHAHETSPEGEANARLIAAAPALLESLARVTEERDALVKARDYERELSDKWRNEANTLRDQVEALRAALDVAASCLAEIAENGYAFPEEPARVALEEARRLEVGQR